MRRRRQVAGRTRVDPRAARALKDLATIRTRAASIAALQIRHGASAVRDGQLRGHTGRGTVETLRFPMPFRSGIASEHGYANVPLHMTMGASGLLGCGSVVGPASGSKPPASGTPASRTDPSRSSAVPPAPPPPLATDPLVPDVPPASAAAPLNPTAPSRPAVAAPLPAAPSVLALHRQLRAHPRTRSAPVPHTRSGVVVTHSERQVRPSSRKAFPYNRDRFNNRLCNSR